MLDLERPELLLKYYSFLENETEIYKLNTLGYPWYYVYRFYHNVNYAANKKLEQFKVQTRPSTIRYDDFLNKVPLINGSYDFVFITKAKMRRQLNGQIENYIFEDVFSYLEEQNKRYLILEMPDGNELIDNKYFESKYFSKTIPFEFIMPSFSKLFEDQKEKYVKEYKHQISDRFIDVKCKEEFKNLHEFTLQTLTGFADQISRIITLQNIFSAMNIKALIGGMGSHIVAGINNNFKVLEIAHGAYEYREDVYSVSKNLLNYYKSNFSLHNYFSLIYSSLGTTYYDMLSPLENRYEYGLPEVRHTKIDDDKLKIIKEQYAGIESKVLVFASNHTVDPEKLENFASIITSSIPNLTILVRPHPTYDAINRYKESNYRIIGHEDASLHELLSLADIVITPPSTVVFEANYYTDKVLVTPPHDPALSLDTVIKQFPCHQVLSLEDPQIINVIKDLLSSPKQKIIHNQDYLQNMNKLFQRIDASCDLPKPITVSGNRLDPKIEARFVKPTLEPHTIDIFVVRSAILRDLSSFINNCSGTILDIGCGQMPYRSLIEQNSNINQYIGLDIENPHYQEVIKPDLFWDGKKIPLPDNSIDFAFATEVFEHVPDLKPVLTDIRRVLKPEGKLFFTVPFLWPLHDAPYDEFRYTPFSLKRILDECGFENIDLQALGGWNASLAQMLGLWLKRAPINDATRQNLTNQFYTFYQELINSDIKPDIYGNQTMITGISGIVTAGSKKVEANNSPITITESVEINCKEFMVKELFSPLSGNLGIVMPDLGATSETFIARQIEHLAPNRSVVMVANVITDDLVKKLNIPTLIENSVTNATFKSENSDQKILVFIKDHNVSSLICHYGTAAFRMAELNERTLKLPLYVHFHGFDAASALHNPDIVNAYKWLAERAKYFLVVSRQMGRRLVHIGVPEEKIILAPYGVEIPNVQTIKDEAVCRFLNVGRLVHKKAPLLLLKAFHLARLQEPNIKLDLIGDGILRDEVKRFIHEHNLASSVILHGAQNHEYVKQYLQQCSVYIQHSITDPTTGDAEGLPNSILEAGSYGLPVISTLHEGIPDAVEHGVSGLLVREYDVEKMAEYMIYLVNNPSIRSSMGLSAREIISSQFSVDHMIKRLRKILGIESDRLCWHVNNNTIIFNESII